MIEYLRQPLGYVGWGGVQAVRSQSEVLGTIPEIGRLLKKGTLSLFTFMHWRRKWQPTPVFLPGESQGRRGVLGCCLWGRTELDTTEAT